MSKDDQYKNFNHGNTSQRDAWAGKGVSQEAP